MSLTFKIDPITRYVYISYPISDHSPKIATIRNEVSFDNRSQWFPASVWKYMSDTAKNLVSQEEWEKGMLEGIITENCSQGLTRTLVWNPFTTFSKDTKFIFRVTIFNEDDIIQQDQINIELDNSDVIFLDDWSKVIQSHFVSEEPNPNECIWWLKRRQNGFTLSVKEIRI